MRRIYIEPAASEDEAAAIIAAVQSIRVAPSIPEPPNRWMRQARLEAVGLVTRDRLGRRR
ncbi:MAG: hypothetical protein ACRDFS_05590 [Chloroflexota bacterium]